MECRRLRAHWPVRYERQLWGINCDIAVMESMDPDPILRVEIVALLLGAAKDFSVSKGLRHFFLRRQEESVEGIFRLAGFDDYKCGVSGNGGGLCGDALRWTESDDEVLGTRKIRTTS